MLGIIRRHIFTKTYLGKSEQIVYGKTNKERFRNQQEKRVSKE